MRRRGSRLAAHSNINLRITAPVTSGPLGSATFRSGHTKSVRTMAMATLKTAVRVMMARAQRDTVFRVSANTQNMTTLLENKTARRDDHGACVLGSVIPTTMWPATFKANTIVCVEWMRVCSLGALTFRNETIAILSNRTRSMTALSHTNALVSPPPPPPLLLLYSGER